MENEKTKRTRDGGRAWRSAEERQQLLAEQAQSGLSKKAFCEERGINLGTFYSWGRTDGSPLAGSSGVDFARYEVELPAETEAPIEVDLPNGVRIKVRTTGAVDKTAELIRQVIRQEPASC